MSNLSLAPEGEIIRGIAKLELPHDIALNAEGLQHRLRTSLEEAKRSRNNVQAASEIAAWKFWRWGEKDKAIMEALKTSSEFQGALAELGVYNIWLSKAIADVQADIASQNRRIEGDQKRINERLEKADEVLRMVGQAGEDLAQYVERAHEERESLAQEAKRASSLLDDYRRHAQTLNDQVKKVARLDNEMREGFAAAHKQLDQHAEGAATMVRAQAGALDDLRSSVDAGFQNSSTRLEVLEKESSQLLAWSDSFSAWAYQEFTGMRSEDALLKKKLKQITWFLSAIGAGLGGVVGYLIWASAH